jgi:hypothetical protein
VTPSQLKTEVEATGSVFFRRDTMRFHGDTMRNYGVRAVRVETNNGDTVDAWELFRRMPVKHGVASSAYFRRDTFTRVFPKRGA